MRSAGYYLKNTLFYIIIGIEFILLILFYSFSRAGTLINTIITGVLLIIPLLVFILYMRGEKKKLKQAQEDHKTFLMTKGKTIKVDLSKCNVYVNKKTVNYDRNDIPTYSLSNRIHSPESIYEDDLPELTFRNQRSKALDNIIFPDLAEEKHSFDRCYCIVEAIISYKGKERSFFSDTIAMDNTSLEMMLAVNKDDGFIYVNQFEDDDYYFDLDFLR